MAGAGHAELMKRTELMRRQGNQDGTDKRTNTTSGKIAPEGSAAHDNTGADARAQIASGGSE